MSGNHGRNSQQTPSGDLNTQQVTTPQQSSKPFISPTGVPIKKSPSIADIVEDKLINDQNQIVIPPKEESKEIKIINEQSNSQEVVEKIPVSDEVETDNLKSQELNASIEISEDLDLTKFSEGWTTLFEEVFFDIPTIYYPLKGIIPILKGNSVIVRLKNNLQKEHFDPKIREILAYLRTNISNQFEDIQVQVDEASISRKVIYDTADKMKNLSEQNSNFEQFNAILDLKVKE